MKKKRLQGEIIIYRKLKNHTSNDKNIVKTVVDQSLELEWRLKHKNCKINYNYNKYLRDMKEDVKYDLTNVNDGKKELKRVYPLASLTH